jgi:hypothetical protein
MADSTIREIRVSAELVERIKEYAYQNRKTVSEVMREWVDRYNEKGYAGIRNPKDKVEDRGRVRIGFVCEDEAWATAADKAWEMRTTRGEALRIIASALTKNVEVP